MLADSLQITVIPRRKTGKLNVLADMASWIGQVVPSERALSSEAFRWMSQIKGSSCTHPRGQMTTLWTSTL